MVRSDSKWLFRGRFGLLHPQPARPLAHVLMGASDEAARYVAEATDRARARSEMIGVLGRLVDGISC